MFWCHNILMIAKGGWQKIISIKKNYSWKNSKSNEHLKRNISQFFKNNSKINICFSPEI